MCLWYFTFRTLTHNLPLSSFLSLRLKLLHLSPSASQYLHCLLRRHNQIWTHFMTFAWLAVTHIQTWWWECGLDHHSTVTTLFHSTSVTLQSYICPAVHPFFWTLGQVSSDLKTLSNCIVLPCQPPTTASIIVARVYRISTAIIFFKKCKNPVIIADKRVNSSCGGIQKHLKHWNIPEFPKKENI